MLLLLALRELALLQLLLQLQLLLRRRRGTALARCGRSGNQLLLPKKLRWRLSLRVCFCRFWSPGDTRCALSFCCVLLELLLLSLECRCCLEKPLLTLLLLLLILLRRIRLLRSFARSELRSPRVHSAEPLVACDRIRGPPPFVAGIALHPVVVHDRWLLLQLLQQLMLLLL